MLARDAQGGYRLPEGRDIDGLRNHAPHGQRSSLWLTEEECKSLVPADPQKGQTVSVPAKLTKRICLYGLVPPPLWVVEALWQPNSLRRGSVQLTVEDVTPQNVRLRIHGSILLSGVGALREWPQGKFIKHLENRYDARVEGTLVYDRAQKKIAR